MSLEQNLLMFCLTRLDEFKIRQDIFQHTPSHIPTTTFSHLLIYLSLIIQPIKSGIDYENQSVRLD